MSKYVECFQNKVIAPDAFLEEKEGLKLMMSHFTIRYQ